MALLHIEIRLPKTIPTCSVFPPRFAPQKHLPHKVKSFWFQMRLPCLGIPRERTRPLFRSKLSTSNQGTLKQEAPCFAADAVKL